MDHTNDEDIRWIEAISTAPPGASIFGRIQKVSQAPDGSYNSENLTGVAVSIRGPESRTVSSDAQGMFRADGLKPGKYVVSATAPERYASFQTQTVTVENHSCADVVWTTRLDGHIRGNVYFADGTPAGGVFLTAKRADGDPHQPWTWHNSYVTSGADGSFDFAELPPGSYVIAANMDFSPQRGSPYYRRAFYPGTAHRSEATIVDVGAGETVNRLLFFLSPDSALPSIPVQVTVLGLDGKPVPHAMITAEDDQWENSVAPISATADGSGKVTLTLRHGVHYDVGAYANLPDFTQACSEPVGIDTHDQLAPLVLMLNHHFGNCWQFKKPRQDR